MGQSPARAMGAGVHGFAPALTSFVGRVAAVAEVAGLLEQRRLVTVTGPGGSGKTRLAAEVAGRVADRFADGVWLAELAHVADPAQVPLAVAAALGVREQPEISAADAVALVLARQQVLLVLDNCEHVIGAAAELCGGLLPACDDVRVLATSREPLRVAGEARYRLAPLTLPDLDDLADAARAEAVALFADRARSVDAHFVLDEAVGPAVVRLVRRLDGMPLAIELAAARVEQLGVAQLLDRLDDRFDLLTTDDRRAVGRHRSLAATVAWSYQLLDEQERRVFRAVSVFPGPFTLRAAEAVAGPGAGPAVLHLVDCSLLVPPRTDADGRSRYVMLETLRRYGARLLAEVGEQEQAAAALAGYALEVAEQAAAGLATATEELAAVRWLDAEDATMRQVLAWALDHDPAVALRVGVALAPWWQLRGRLRGEYLQLGRATTQAGPGSETWGIAQYWLGRMAFYISGPDGALDHYTAVRDAGEDRPPSRALANCLGGRAAALADLGRTTEAVQDGRRALTLARELDYPAGQALALLHLSMIAGYSDDLDGHVQLAREAEQIPAGIPGWIMRATSDILTVALIDAGELADARRSCATGLARARDVGDVRYQAAMLYYLAYLDLQAGRLEDAAEHVRETLQAGLRVGGQVKVANVADLCGYLCVATGRYAEAVTVWAAYRALMGHLGFRLPPSDERRRAEPLRQARKALGQAQTQVAEDRGAAMSLATAAEYALMLTAPAPQPQPPPELAALSARERELVALIARGRTDAQIAAQLSISIRTVRSHLDRIRGKTGCRRRADLTRLALAAGLV